MTFDAKGNPTPFEAPTRAFLRGCHMLNAAAATDKAAREAITRRLIGILRDTTESRAVHAECVAILGDRP